MLSNIYLLHFNNYYNRIVKRFDTLEEYLALDNGNTDVVLAKFDKVNFIPNDGVDTTQVVNYSDIHPDYLLVTEDTKVTTGNTTTFKEEIVSRWFVVHQKRTTHGQLELTLHRDVVADYYDETMSTTCFVEKGNITDINDPAIYNSEDMGFNQIKKNQTKLFDKTGCSWVVGYIPRDAFSYTVNADGTPTTTKRQDAATIKQNFPIPLKKDVIVKGGLEQWPLYKYLNQSNIFTPRTINHYWPGGIGIDGVMGRLPGLLGNGNKTYAGSATVNRTGYYTSTNYSDGSWNSGAPYFSTSPTGGSNYTTQATATKIYAIKDTKGEQIGDFKRQTDLQNKFAGTFLTALWYQCFTGGVTYPTPNVGNMYDASQPRINSVDKQNEIDNQFINFLYNCSEQEMSRSDYNQIYYLDKKILYDEQEKRYYQINVTINVDNVTKHRVHSSSYNDYINKFRSSDDPGAAGKYSIYCGKVYTAYGVAGQPIKLADAYINWEDARQVSDIVYPYCCITTVTFSLTGLSSELEVDIPPSYPDDATQARVHLQDSPYDMFCLPYKDGLKFKSGDDTVISSSSSLAALCIAQGIPIDTQAGSGTIYDIQLLPYCPVANYIVDEDGTLNLSEVRYNLVSGTSSDGTSIGNQSVLIWCDRASFSVDLPYTISEETDPLKKKIKNLTDVYRLSSPNWAGGFDFNPMKNNGVPGFKANCTYKPYNPYIHVEPVFQTSGLYGGDFQDARGLICGGDFSTAQVTSAWADYQMNNKTYQLQFDRDITHMETMNKIDRDEQAVNAAFSTLQGGAQGAAAGANAGPIGAIVGAAVGTLTSAAGAAADAAFLQQRQKENLDYTKDMYGFNMQNIQMVPQGLAKVAADNANNTLVPVLEYYSCSETELKALANKLKYNGMTIMRIGQLSEFTQKVNYANLKLNNVTDQTHVYVKGKLIRLEDLKEDYHVAMALKEEINMGVFI